MIAITETWATSAQLMKEFSIPGYESFHKKKKKGSTRKEGGVICYVKSDYPAVIISKQDSEKYDTVCIEVATSRHDMLTIGSVYRPPKQQVADDTALYSKIQAMTQNKQSVIIGEFNCPSIDWTILSGDQEGNRLLEMSEDTFLTQIVTQPTRREKKKLLDLVLVRDSDLPRECQVGEKLSGCDHHLIRLTIRTDQELIENKSRIPDYRRANFSLVRELLSRTTWEPVNFTSIDRAWNTFKCKLLEVERSSVPIKTRRRNNAMSPPWITSHQSKEEKVQLSEKKQH